jgi:hypothetical protein
MKRKERKENQATPPHQSVERCVAVQDRTPLISDNVLILLGRSLKMSGKKRKIRERNDDDAAEETENVRDDTEDGLVQIKKLSASLFSHENGIIGSPSPPPMEDVIEVLELQTEEVILTIEDLVMKFVKQILLDGSCLIPLLSQLMN